MQNTINLTKILLKNSRNINKEKKPIKKIGFSLLIIVLILYVIALVAYVSYEIVTSLQSVNQEKIFLSVCLLLSVGVTLFKTILTALNVLYFSKDVELLLPLPIKPINIVLAKFNVMLISEYITEIITFIVPFAVYGYIMKIGISFYLLSILVFLLLPIIPMLISILLIVLVMRFTKFLRNKDNVQYLSVFLIIIVVVAVQFIGNSSTEITNFMIANKMIEINGLADMFSDYFITIKQANIIITETDNIEIVKNLIMLVAESIGAYILVAYLTSKTYIKTAIYLTSSSDNKKIRKSSEKFVGLSYVQKEFKMLVRNPIFFLQCVLPSVLFPIIFTIPIYSNLSDIGIEELDAFKEALSVALEDSIGIGIILVIINLLYLFNFISVTAISRDGKNAIFMKYIPVPLHKQCKYKVIPSILLNLLPLFYVLGMIKYFMPNATLLILSEIFIVGFICNVVISYFAIIIDLIKPKLYWTSEYSVVKQNINMLYDAMLIFVIIGIILAIYAYIENIHIATITINAIAIITLILYEIFMRKYSRQIFKKIS